MKSTGLDACFASQIRWGWVFFCGYPHEEVDHRGDPGEKRQNVHDHICIANISGNGNL